MHAKIIPEWAPAPQAVLRTMKKPAFEKIILEDESADNKVVPSDEGEQGPQLATA